MLIMTTYHGPTDHKGARITARRPDSPLGIVIVPYDYAASDPHKIAVDAFLAKHGIAANVVKFTDSHPRGLFYVVE